jgi:hypothetical protein
MIRRTKGSKMKLSSDITPCLWKMKKLEVAAIERAYAG